MNITQTEAQKVAMLYETVIANRKRMRETNDPNALCNLYMAEVEATEELWNMGIPVVGYSNMQKAEP